MRTLQARRAAALVGGLVVIVLFGLLIKGCRDSARRQSFVDYAHNIAAFTDQSNQESRSLFTLLTKPSTQGPVELQSAVNGYRTDAAQLVDRVRGTGHPDEMSVAHRYLVDTLELRRDGIGSVADQLPSALGSTGADAAAARIATSMQDFLASDVIFAQRFTPSFRDALGHENLLGNVTVPHSQFLPDLSWLTGGNVTNRISGLRGGGPAAPGNHHVTVGTVIAKPGGLTLNQNSTIRIPASPNLSFDATISNQGDNTEKDVVVKLSISGAATPIEVDQRVASIAPGAQTTVSIPLAQAPPTGQPATVSVVVQPVPGEKDTTNTKAAFPVVFTP